LAGLFLSRLSKPYSGATAALVEELDAPPELFVRSLQCSDLQGDFAEMQGACFRPAAKIDFRTKI
jgi:hypothetical protein